MAAAAAPVVNGGWVLGVSPTRVRAMETRTLRALAAQPVLRALRAAA